MLKPAREGKRKGGWTGRLSKWPEQQISENNNHVMCLSLSFFSVKDVFTDFLSGALFCHPVPPCAPYVPPAASTWVFSWGGECCLVAGNELEEQYTLSEWLVTIRGKQVREGVCGHLTSFCSFSRYVFCSPGCLPAFTLLVAKPVFFSPILSSYHTPSLTQQSDREEVTSTKASVPHSPKCLAALECIVCGGVDFS